jgi:hypothetical protein
MLHCTCPISQSFGPWPLAKKKTKPENVKMTQCCKPGLRLAKRPHARHRHKMFRQCQTGPPCPLAQPGKHQVIIVKGKFSLSQRWTVKLCDSSIRLGSAGHGLARPSDGPRVTGTSAALYDLVLYGMGVTIINYYCDSKTITATPADPNVSSCASLS